MLTPMSPQPTAPASDPPRVLSRTDLLVGLALFAGLIFVLGLAAAVLVKPSLIDSFVGFWPLLLTIGFASTAGGLWWLWRRPR